MKTFKNSVLDFSNQKFFIGIDVHKNNWKVTIQSTQIQLKTFSMNPSVVGFLYEEKIPWRRIF